MRRIAATVSRPLSSGISTSRMTASGLTCAMRASAILPLEAVPTASIAGCCKSIWVSILRTTTESSTTRILSLGNTLALQHPQHLQLGNHRILGKRLNKIFIGAGLDRETYMSQVAGGGNHQDLESGGSRLRAHSVQKLDPVHNRHVPVDQDQIDLAMPRELRHAF